MTRFFVYAILAWLAYFLVKKILKELFASSGTRETPGAPSDTELIRDPECGAYFMKQKGIKGIVNGNVMHFCSEQCYDKYLKSHSRQ